MKKIMSLLLILGMFVAFAGVMSNDTGPPGYSVELSVDTDYAQVIPVQAETLPSYTIIDARPGEVVFVSPGDNTGLISSFYFSHHLFAVDDLNRQEDILWQAPYYYTKYKTMEYSMLGYGLWL